MIVVRTGRPTHQLRVANFGTGSPYRGDCGENGEEHSATVAVLAMADVACQSTACPGLSASRAAGDPITAVCAAAVQGPNRACVGDLTDPHALGIPRISARAKSAPVEIQADEYGNGAPGRAHAELFAQTMRNLDCISAALMRLTNVGSDTLV